jgi:hypothetical protein
MRNAVFVFVMILFILAIISINGKAAYVEAEKIKEIAINDTRIATSPEKPLMQPIKKEPGFEFLLALILVLALANLKGKKRD